MTKDESAPSHLGIPSCRRHATGRRQFLKTAMAATVAGAPAACRVLAAEPGVSPSLIRRTTQHQTGKSGFFRLDRMNDDWYVVAPSGTPVYLTGMNHLGDNSVYPLQGERHTDFESWLRSVRKDLRDWGFNYLGPTDAGHVNSTTVIKPSERTGRVVKSVEWLFDRNAALDYPFSVMLELPESVYGDGYPDVFADKFVETLDRHCARLCAPLKSNTNLIGYHFTHNPHWSNVAFTARGFGEDFTNWIHRIVNVPNSPARRMWVSVMRRIYGTVENYKHIYYPIKHFDELHTLPNPCHGVGGRQWVKRDMVAFVREMARQWYRVWHNSIRKYDPNHLILGDRITTHFQIIPTYILDVMEPYVDLLSTNMMGSAHQLIDNLRDVLTHWTKPILVGDVGARVFDGSRRSGAKLGSDEEVGQFYWDHMKLGVEHPLFIGLAWCGYWETTNHHSGVRDGVTGEINQVVIDEMRKANAWAQKTLQERVGAVN